MTHHLDGEDCPEPEDIRLVISSRRDEDALTTENHILVAPGSSSRWRVEKLSLARCFRLLLLDDPLSSPARTKQIWRSRSASFVEEKERTDARAARDAGNKYDDHTLTFCCLRSASFDLLVSVSDLLRIDHLDVAKPIHTERRQLRHERVVVQRLQQLRDGRDGWSWERRRIEEGEVGGRDLYYRREGQRRCSIVRWT